MHFFKHFQALCSDCLTWLCKLHTLFKKTFHFFIRSTIFKSMQIFILTFWNFKNDFKDFFLLKLYFHHLSARTFLFLIVKKLLTFRFNLKFAPPPKKKKFTKKRNSFKVHSCLI
jgi:hypothetical protein